LEYIPNLRQLDIYIDYDLCGVAYPILVDWQAFSSNTVRF
jgi:hypothetical protein